MASLVVFINLQGQTILARDYCAAISLPLACEVFNRNVTKADQNQRVPVFTEDGITFCWVKHADFYLVAATMQNTNAIMLLSFLKKFLELMTVYFHKCEEEAIRSHFVTTYELLDEAMDNGMPQFTEARSMRRFITAKHLDPTTESPSCLTGGLSWRPEGIKHKKNEIFLDVIERIDAMVGANSQILRSEIVGQLKMKSYLSGMPELKLGLNEKLAISDNPTNKPGNTAPTVDLEDVRFHHCVSLDKWEAERLIAFVPPDGEFDLMTYRVGEVQNPHEIEDMRLPFWAECTLSPQSFDLKASRVDYIIKLKSTFKPRSVASTVELVVPAPCDAASPVFKTSSGSAKYHPDKKAFIWTLKHFQGQREQLLTASLSRPTVAQEEDYFFKRPLELRFEIPYFTLSGLTVKYLKIFEASGYQALPWVRYITQNGSYQIRIS